MIPSQPLSAAQRATAIRSGIRLEIISVIWMVIESVLAIGAGLLARSVVLTAFGFDSVIELLSAIVLLWRLSVEAHAGTLDRVEQAERRSVWVSGVLLVLLCFYVVATTAFGLLTHSKPEQSVVGIAVALIAVVVMPLLARAKRRVAERMGSMALRADAVETITCAYMAAAALLGLGLNALLGWWWADYVTALALLYWLVGETREVLAAAREGRRGCDDD
jgi:divalent metal cation (Fe/Co/Zn/Cd) transporter